MKATETNSGVMKGYKGFNEKLQCTPGGKVFQYEIGGSYEEPNADLCKNGFHFCENPLDVFNYYAPSGGRFCEIEAEKVSNEKGGDTKRTCKHIKIGAEISLKSLCDAAVKFIFERVDWENKKESNTGDGSAATNTGDRSAATNTGYRSAATNTGNGSAATVGGDDSIAIVTGKDSFAKGKLGCWLVLTERDNCYKIIGVKSVKVDGEKIKADTFYWLRGGKIVEYSPC